MSARPSLGAQPGPLGVKLLSRGCPWALGAGRGWGHPVHVSLMLRLVCVQTAPAPSSAVRSTRWHVVPVLNGRRLTPAIVSCVLCPCSDLKLRVRILIDGTLIIFRVKPEDAGKYTCVPSNSLGRSPSASAYLTVQCEWGRLRPRWPHGGLEGCVEAMWAEEGPRRGRDSAGGGLTRAGQRR